MLSRTDVVFLVDVDNTLLDNDRFATDLTARLDHAFGIGERERYWSIFRELRDKNGFADYLGALQIFRLANEDEVSLLQMSAFFLDYPFADRLYPSARAAIKHLGAMGTTVILSDGDIVFQPRKIQRSGLWDAFDGRVLIYIHKEAKFDNIQQSFPAVHYVMIEDKPHQHAAMKGHLGDRLTTIFVRQGHYAVESSSLTIKPFPDFVIDGIVDLCEFTLADFTATATGLVEPNYSQKYHAASTERP